MVLQKKWGNIGFAWVNFLVIHVRDLMDLVTEHLIITFVQFICVSFCSDNKCFRGSVTRKTTSVSIKVPSHKTTNVEVTRFLVSSDAGFSQSPRPYKLGNEP